jgi:O-antigen/teichoic acid export membrane protein
MTAPHRMLAAKAGKPLLLVGLRGLGAGANLIALIAFARLLGPANYGLFALMVATIAIMNAPLGAAAANLVMREVARGTASEDWRRARGLLRCAILGVGLLIAVAVLAVLTAGALAPRYQLVLAFGAGALVFDAISALRAAILRGIGAPLLAQGPDTVVKPFVLAAGGLTLSATTGGPISLESAIFVLPTASAITAIAGWLALSLRRTPVFARGERVYDRRWVGGMIALAGSSLLIVGGSYVETFILAAMATPESVGLYRLAAQIALASSLGYAAVNFTAAPAFSSAVAADGGRGLSSLAREYAWLAFALCIPAPVVIVVVGRPLLAMAFGEDYIEAFEPLLILLFAQLVNAAAGLGASLLLALGRERWTIVGALCGVAVCAIGGLILIPAYGAAGAAWANALGVLAANLVYIAVLMTSSKLNPTIIAIAEPAKP